MVKGIIIPTAKTPDNREVVGSGVKPISPKWDDVYNAYNSIGQMPGDNSGAERVLLAIIKASGGDTNTNNKDANNVLKKIQKHTTSRDKVETLKKWLLDNKNWRKTEKKVTYPIEADNRKAIFLSRIDPTNSGLPHNGVYIMLGSKTNSYHESRATLWIGTKQDVINGSNLIEKNYENSTRKNQAEYPDQYDEYNIFNVYFWELLDDHPSRCGKVHNPDVQCIYGNVCKEPSTKIQDVLGCCHMEMIRNKINSASDLMGDIGKRLKELWDRYEHRLTIHDTEFDPTEKALFGGAEGHPEAGPGVFINIAEGMNKLKGDYFGLKAYEVIIHELFHNIDYLIAQDIGSVSSVFERKFYQQARFNDDFQKNKIPVKIVDYPNFCWRLITGFAEKIISETRRLIKWNSEAGSYENGYKTRISTDVASVLRKVNDIYESSNAGLIYIIHGGRKNVSNNMDNHMYAVIYGEKDPSYWGKPTHLTEIMMASYGHNLDRNSEDDVYHCKLSSEAFANIAAAAIANSDTSKDTFIQMTEILQESCEYFIKMLNMICAMLKNVPQHEG